MKAAVIIPVYNRQETTLRCLQHLEEIGLSDQFGIIVVDDGSLDGTAKAVADRFPEVVLLQGDGSLYWAGAIRKGMEQALALGVEYLFWLNDDCFPDRGALERMLEYLERNPRTICGASCFSQTESVQTGFRGRTRLKHQEHGVSQVEGLSGYCVGLPAEVCARIGLPNARRVPHYAADTVYTLRAFRRGFRLTVIPEAKAFLMDRPRDVPIESLARGFESGRGEFVRKLFFRKKSLYYLPGQYWYHYYKYRPFLGSAIFLWKLLGWIWVALTQVKASRKSG